jgi:hypothetical protein
MFWWRLVLRLLKSVEIWVFASDVVGRSGLFIRWRRWWWNGIVGCARAIADVLAHA